MSQAGKNRHALEQVIDHYQSVDRDSLKLKAAYFLIENMPGKYTLTAPTADQYQKLLVQISKEHAAAGGFSPTAIRLALDSARKNIPVEYQTKMDLENISSDLLIANIDSAFSQWRSAQWSENYTFEEFCKWVLPYRFSHEKLENWRSIALSDKRIGEDSVRALNDILQMGVLLVNHTGLRYGADSRSYPFTLSFGEMSLVRQGGCGEMADYMTQTLRARGIPASTEIVPTWANRSSSHAWNAIILPDGKCEPLGYHAKGYLQMQDKIPKIYRDCFFIDYTNVLYRYKDTEEIPSFFLSSLDVTAKYNMPVYDVKVSDLKKGKNNIVWLSCFNNYEWIPVAYAEKIGNEAVFKDMGCGRPIRRSTKLGEGIMMAGNTEIPYQDMGNGIVYLPVYWKDHELVSAAYPLILDSLGQIFF